MNNPGLAIWLYVAILLMAFMFSPRWGNLVGVITQGAHDKQVGSIGGLASK